MSTNLLGDICEFKYGSALQERVRRPGPFPVFGSNGEVGRHSDGLTDGPTVIVGRKGSVGKIIYCPQSCWPIDTAYYIDRTCTPHDLKWLSYALGSLGLDALNKATGVPGLNRNDAYRKALYVPPLDEQRRIAAILDQADDLRRTRSEALRGLSRLERAHFNALFADLSAWPEAAFESLVEENKIGLVRGASEFGDGMPFPYVRMNAITRDGGIDSSTIKSTNASELEARAYALEDGDFLFNTRNSRELVGKTAVWRGKSGSLFNNNIMRIRFNSLVDPEFVAALFSTDPVKHELEKRKTGTTSVFAVYWRDLRSLRLRIPPRELQTRFSSAVAGMRKQRESMEQHLAALDGLFASLQHRAFAGEL